MYKENFPKRFKLARIEAGYTQEQVSKETGILRSSISKYETGIVEPNLEALAILAQFYNVSINWLLGVTLEAPIRPITKSKPYTYKEESVAVQKK